MPGDTSSAASYATATDNLRTSARWLLTAAARAGAVLVAGVQLTSIGSLGLGEWPRLVAAVAGLAAGLGAVGYMIWQASLLLTDKWITLTALEERAVKQLLRIPAAAVISGASRKSIRIRLSSIDTGRSSSAALPAPSRTCTNGSSMPIKRPGNLPAQSTRKRQPTSREP